MLKDYFWLGVKNLRRRGIRSWLTLLGIVIGIAAVVSLISLGDGLKMAVNSQFGVSSTEVLTVQAGGLNGYGPPGTGVSNPLTIQDSEAIEKLDTVDISIPRNIETVKIEFNDKILIGYAASIAEGEKRDYIYEVIDVDIESGRFLKDGDTNKIFVGNNFVSADKNGFDKEVQVGNKLSVKGKDFEVIGILKKKGSFILDSAIYMDDTPLRELQDTGDDVDIIAVKVKDKSLMTRAKSDIEKLLRNRRNVDEGEEDFEVSTPEAMLGTVNQILNGVQAFIVLIALASILVGAIGIINTMTTSVMERKKEIGVMKAIGAKNSDIFLQFFIESGLMGLIGGLIGVIIGGAIGFIGTAVINNFIGVTATPTINVSLVLLALFGGFIIGSISGIAPAIQAAKQRPVEVLRD